MTTQDFEQEAPLLRRLAFDSAEKLGRQADEAEDIVQDSLVKLWLLRNHIQSAQQAHGLIITIVRQHIIDEWRHNTAHRTTELPTMIADEHGKRPDEELEHKELELWLKQRLDSLPRTEHHVLRLRQEEHLDNRQIAALLGITPASVATLLSRCRQRLLKEIRQRTRQ